MSNRHVAPLIALAFAAPALTGCLTPHAQPPPSPAIVAARQGVGAAPMACQTSLLATVSPAVATFPFDEPALDEAGTTRVKRLANWLNCNPGVPVSILPTADNHGSDQHMRDLASARAKAVSEALRSFGAASVVIHIAALGAPDPLSGPHLVIQADGRGW